MRDKSSAQSKRPINAWMVYGPAGAEIETIRTTRRDAIWKFCDREMDVPSAWRYHKQRGYRAIKVKVCL